MEPTLTNGSEIVCIPEQDCHMQIITKPDSNGKWYVYKYMSKYMAKTTTLIELYIRIRSAWTSDYSDLSQCRALIW